jgi:hypothetical protein
MADKKEYVEVEGIKCEVKDPSRRATVLYYQESLRNGISDYERSVSSWTAAKEGYRSILLLNVILAPFVLGWLQRPEDPDEYRVIKGLMTLDELNKKRKKDSKPKAEEPKKQEKETKKTATKTVSKKSTKKK